MGAETEDLACRELVELITDYLEGTLAERDRRRFEAHLPTCRGCREYLAQMRRTVATVGALRENEIPAEVMDELLRSFRGWKASIT